MAKYQLSTSHLHQALYHTMTPTPIIMIARQPPLGHVVLVILLHMVLIGRENPGPRFGKVELHEAQARCVAWRMAHCDPRSELEDGSMKRGPVDVHVKILRDVRAWAEI